MFSIALNREKSSVFDSPDKLREVVLKFNEQNALDEMILAPATYENMLSLILIVEPKKPNNLKNLKSRRSPILPPWP